MRKLIFILCLSIILIASACVSKEPSESDEYAEDLAKTSENFVDTDDFDEAEDSAADKAVYASGDGVSDADSEAEDSSLTEITSVEELQNTKHFGKHALEHIFYGQVNSRGNATGYHTESIPNSHGAVIEGSQTKPDEYGVYEAKVEVDGIKKSGNGGKSTLYPISWDAQRVVNAINEAYEDREFVKGSDNVYRGIADDGVVIEMYLDKNKKIISAFPILQ